MSSNHSIIPFSVAIALAIGWVVSPLDRSISEALEQRGEVESLRQLDSQFGQGLSVAVLGGYRSLTANLVWLSKNRNWEKRDFAGTFAKIGLVTSIDPRPEIFWLNGSRIIANDMPAWEVGDRNTDKLANTEEGRKIAHQYAKRALLFLEKSRIYHSENPDIYLEEAMIYWLKLDDLESAAERFLRATQATDPPFHAFRIYGEILTRLGRKQEALDFFEQHYKTLPDNLPEAMKVVVGDRIRTLRQELAASSGDDA
ncbi:MAG: tetratricopeptide (TPR) repeat protein [Candidatus Pelagisphaera sp.]